MTETVRQKAAADLKMIEDVTAVLLPEPTTELVPLAKADKPVAAEIKKRMAEIDMENTGSIIGFGSGAQAELQEISQAMLADVRNKDVGPAGDSLARDRDDDPGLLDQRAGCAAQAVVVGTADGQCGTFRQVRGALRGCAGPDRQGDRQPVEP